MSNAQLIDSPAWADTARGHPLDHIDAPWPAVYTHIGRANHYGVGRRGYNIRFIVAHTTESDTSTRNCLLYDSYRDNNVSCTAFTAMDGIGYDVPENDRPFTTGRWNDESLSNEISGEADYSAAYWIGPRHATIDNTVRLWTDWCLRYNIPPVWIDNPNDLLLPHTRGVFDHLTGNDAAKIEDPRRIGHTSYSHTDVGAGLREVIINHILPAVTYNITQPNTGALDMNTARIIRFKPYANQFLVGVGPAMLLTPELARSYRGMNPTTGEPIPNYPADLIVPFLEVAAHDTALKSVLHQAGLAITDLAPA